MGFSHLKPPPEWQHWGGVYRIPAGAVRGWEVAAAAGFGSPELPKLKCYRAAEELGGERKEEMDFWEGGECPVGGTDGFDCAGSVGGSQILGMLLGIPSGIRCLGSPSVSAGRAQPLDSGAGLGMLTGALTGSGVTIPAFPCSSREFHHPTCTTRGFWSSVRRKIFPREKSSDPIPLLQGSIPRGASSFRVPWEQNSQQEFPLQGASPCVCGATHGASSRSCRGKTIPCLSIFVLWKGTSWDGEFIPPAPNSRDLLSFPLSPSQGKSTGVFCRFLALSGFPGCLFQPKGVEGWFFPCFPPFPSCQSIPGVCLSSLGHCVSHHSGMWCLG